MSKTILKLIYHIFYNIDEIVNLRTAGSQTTYTYIILYNTV